MKSKILRLKDEVEPFQIQYVYWIDDERDPNDYLSEGEYKDTLWLKD